MTRKEYVAPELTILGDIEHITLASTELNADSPAGNPDTAYPVAS
jgi:hypothetical protein